MKQKSSSMVSGHIDRLVVKLDPKSGSELENYKPLSDFSYTRAIILLGDPGMGKTEELRHAAALQGARMIPVQEAVHRSALGGAEQRLFLDALDESRSAGGTIDALIAKLVDTGKPSFILSCRVADWYGPSDLRRIQQIYGEANVAVLRLLGFTRAQAKEFITGLVPDPDAFVQEAERRGIEEWLENPNDLLLLTKIAASGWPSTRLELFERSSVQMAREQNLDRARSLPTIHDDVLLDAAGAVCTSLLVTGSRGVCLDQVGNTDPNFATSTDFAADPTLVERIVKSNLFVGETPRYTKPRHRTTAEFLAARWLARQIASGGITLRRVLAIVAPDGKPPTELRGILAWLITRLPNAEAMQVIGADPFGLLIYGDADTFDATRLNALLGALEHLAKTEPYFRVTAWADGPWLAFIRPELSARISSILAADIPNGHLLDGLLTALSKGNVIDGVAASVLMVLYNLRVHVETKTRAVRAYVRQARSCGQLDSVFKDCTTGNITDKNGHIRIEIFRRCHDHIPATGFAALLAELWDDRDLRIGSLHYRFVEEIPTATLAMIFDLLSEEQRRRANIHSPGGLSPHHCGFEIRHFLEKALVRVEADNLATIERIANWRHLFSARQSGNDNTEWQALWTRFNQDARLFIYVFEREVLSGDPADLWSRFVHRLWSHDSVISVSNDAVRYLIELASTEANEDRAKAIARCATMFVWGSAKGPEIYLLAQEIWTAKSCLAPFLAGLGYWEIPDWRIEQARRTKAHQIRAQRERERTVKLIKENLDGIREWRHFNLLQFVGQLYFFGWGFISRAGSDSKLTKHEAFEALLGRALAAQLKDALTDGIRGATLPLPDEQAQWRINNQHYTAEYAVLAAMELLLERCPSAELPPESVSAVVGLAVHHWGTSTLTESKREGDGTTDGWFWKQFRAHSDLVIESIVRSLKPLAQRGDRLFDLGPLLANANAAPEASVRLASAVLNELRPSSHEDLDGALQILLANGEADVVANEVGDRLTGGGTPKERAYWLGIGWLASPQTFSNQLAGLVRDGTEEEVWIALRVIFPERHGAPSRVLTLAEVGWLAEQFGGRFGRVERPSGVTTGVTNPWDATEIVNRLVDIISGDSCPDATAKLAYLSEIENLKSYRDGVLHALAMQRNRRRDMEFSPPTLSDLKNALQKTGITSADDAVALTIDQVEFLQRQYRGGDTTGWRKYWSTAKRGVITEPKIEDHCRDVLLDDLRPRLQPYGLEVNQATPANAGNEADASIQKTGAVSIRIPVEMKMSTNREVWTAPRDQLSRKYMIDPHSGGRGIYVVFWTGLNGVPAPPNGLTTPSSTEEMQRLLTDLLSTEERRQIAIAVLDISPSPSKKYER